MTEQNQPRFHNPLSMGVFALVLSFSCLALAQDMLGSSGVVANTPAPAPTPMYYGNAQTPSPNPTPTLSPGYNGPPAAPVYSGGTAPSPGYNPVYDRNFSRPMGASTPAPQPTSLPYLPGITVDPTTGLPPSPPPNASATP